MSETENIWIGFDLGGTKMLALALDDNLTELSRERKKTKGADSNIASVDRIIKTIRDALKTNNKKIAGIGIGAPGALDLATGAIVSAPNLGWKNVQLKEQLEKEFSCPVVISNDVDAGIYGEYTLGVAKGTFSAVGIFPGTGIGGGCVYNGELVRGAKTSCMELGHIPVIPDGLLCGCGRRGCLETVASRLAISAASAMSIYRGEAPYLEKVAGTDLSKIRSGALAEAIAAGDKSIEAIVRQAAQWLGKAAAIMVNLLTPDMIVLGGGLVEAMPDIYKTEVANTARKFVMPSYEKMFKVEVAKLGDNATALGAAAWARKVIKGSK